ncbi:hypothetical protein A5739_20755 [Mycobacterium colombiense]|uniref:hypothetical protein n=1 Tax=Mycobacterium colombiense TaxID=339268 RepID=UPI00096CFB16|nr:hypothetical protein [Mycobacterium colombiense]OMC26316.1 hypothetical protein A5739_20755 [Mycobacterium colombiense]
MPGTNSPLELDADRVALIDAEEEAARAEELIAAARARVAALRLRRHAEAADGGASETSKTAATDGVSTPPADEAERVAPASADDGVERTRRRFRRPRRTTVAVGVAVVCTAALLAVSAMMVRHQRDLVHKQQDAAEFTAAARQVVVTLMSINAASAKDDVQRIIDSTTGQFKDEFQRAAEDFAKVAQSAKVSTKTSVQAAAVESMTEDTAVVLVAASSTLTNAAGATEQPRSWRLSLKLAREGGKIKMSSMEFIP